MKKKSIAEKFAALFSENEKLTPKEAIELATMASDAVELKFVNAVSGEKTFKVEGDEVVVGAVIYEIGSDGEDMEAADGEYEFTVEGFEPFMVVVEAGMVKEVAELVAIEEAPVEEAPAVEAELSEEGGLESRLQAIEEILSPLMLSAKNPRDFKAEFSAMEATMLETIRLEMAKVPAISELKVKQEFSKDVKENKNPNEAMINMYSRKKK